MCGRIWKPSMKQTVGLTCGRCGVLNVRIKAGTTSKRRRNAQDQIAGENPQENCQAQKARQSYIAMLNGDISSWYSLESCCCCPYSV